MQSFCPGVLCLHYLRFCYFFSAYARQVNCKLAGWLVACLLALLARMHSFVTLNFDKGWVVWKYAISSSGNKSERNPIKASSAEFQVRNLKTYTLFLMMDEHYAFLLSFKETDNLYEKLYRVFPSVSGSWKRRRSFLSNAKPSASVFDTSESIPNTSISHAGDGKRDKSSSSNRPRPRRAQLEPVPPTPRSLPRHPPPARAVRQFQRLPRQDLPQLGRPSPVRMGSCMEKGKEAWLQPLAWRWASFFIILITLSMERTRWLTVDTPPTGTKGMRMRIPWPRPPHPFRWRRDLRCHHSLPICAHRRQPVGQLRQLLVWATAMFNMATPISTIIRPITTTIITLTNITIPHQGRQLREQQVLRPLQIRSGANLQQRLLPLRGSTITITLRWPPTATGPRQPTTTAAAATAETPSPTPALPRARHHLTLVRLATASKTTRSTGEPPRLPRQPQPCPHWLASTTNQSRTSWPLPGGRRPLAAAVITSTSACTTRQRRPRPQPRATRAPSPPTTPLVFTVITISSRPTSGEPMRATTATATTAASMAAMTAIRMLHRGTSE